MLIDSIDICTTGLARGTVLECMRSLRATVNFGTAKLRWIYLLDVHPLGYLEENRQETLRQAAEASRLFDHSVILTPGKNIGIGRTLVECFRLTTSDLVFVAEDDKLWDQPVNLQEALEHASEWDYLPFSALIRQPGAYSPAIWKRPMVEEVTAWVDALDPATLCNELSVKWHCRKLWRKAGLRYGIPSPEPYRDVGFESLLRGGAPTTRNVVNFLTNGIFSTRQWYRQARHASRLGLPPPPQFEPSDHRPSRSERRAAIRAYRAEKARQRAIMRSRRQLRAARRARRARRAQDSAS
jgi:hypothetical protein